MRLKTKYDFCALLKHPLLKHPYFPLYALLFIILVPLLLAHLAFYAAPFIPISTMNTGRLLPQSPIFSGKEMSSQAKTTTEKWQLVFYKPSDCKKSCETTLQLLNSIQVLFLKHQARLSLHIVEESSKNDLYRTQLIDLAIKNKLPLAESTWIIHPQGDILLYYAGHNFNAKGLIKDLKRLLSIKG